MEYLILTLSVWLGGIIFLTLKKRVKNVKLLLTFSGAYLFGIIIFHLLPEIYGQHSHVEHHHEHIFNPKLTGIFLISGLIFQLILELFSHGIEHGHEHHHTPVITAGIFAGLFLHAFAEGLPVHLTSGHAYLYGIVVHKIPIAFIIASFLASIGYKPVKIFIVLLLFSLMSPLGAFIAGQIEFLKENHVYVNAFAAGVLTHISTTILFESDKEHQFHLKKFAVILLAFLLSYLTA